jgi:L-2-hydroxyglutarate oxidase
MSGGIQAHNRFDAIIIGGGILGASTAMQYLERYPHARVLLLEKESEAAAHQTGHNSGVIHAGVYYAPGSLKAKFCKAGNKATKAFCDEEGIPYDECGKLLVATDDAELERMQGLIQRCADNELEIEVLDQAALSAREPNVRGVGAIFVPSTGIVSYSRITERMLERVRQQGGEVNFNAPVSDISETEQGVTVKVHGKPYQADQLIVCAGLMSDRLVQLAGLTPRFKIVPFRGEYYQLPAQHNQIVNHLIYPIPDPKLPFLGVHLTKMIDGSVTVGPNAVLALKREGYRKWDISLADSWEMLTFKGLRQVVKTHWQASLNEFKNSFSKRGYLALVQKYSPSLTLDDLQPYPAGVRAQAISEEGKMVDDFLFIKTDRMLFVCNAPSPAATSAVPIGAHILDQLND